jgi:tetratricopeptide (TPR) repeat protein
VNRLGALVVVVAACGAAQHPAPQPNVRAEVRAAELAERARQHDVARTKYEQAVADARDPASIGFARFRFGETLATWGEYAQAQQQLEAAVAATPDDPAPWHDLGVLREHAGDSRGALAAFEHAKADAPTDWRPRLSLAALHWKLAGACLHDAGGSCTPEIDAAKAEYRAMLALDLPQRLRDKVEWALGQLDQPNAGLRPAAPAPTP